MAQLCCLLAPSAGFQIAMTKIPIGRLLVFPHGGHAGNVPHSPTYLKRLIVLYRGIFSVETAEECAVSTYRYTIGQRERDSIRWVNSSIN